MTIFDSMSTYGYGEAHLVRDEQVRLRAVVAIHDSRRGPALGGCRFVSYMNEEAAVTDALRLARAMTFKAALAGLPHGGGKSVILAPSGEFDRPALLTRFAAFVDALGGRYITAEDAGTSLSDMELMRARTKHVVGLPVERGGSGDPSPFTALGVRRGIEACVELALGKRGLEGVHVAVQGVGNVGYHLCKELSAAGARITCSDVREELAERAGKEFGAKVVPAAEIHRVACDVYAPCALGGAINDRTLPQLQCKIVAGAANNQLASDDCGNILHSRGVLYAPDYAINAGGLINVAQEVAGYNVEIARTKTLDIHATIWEICQRSRVQDTPPQRVADAMVQEILEESATS
ncbi:MAG TPA: Glu/Leu/Phe/Val dehydrogenase dimerization domain-containing protein [Polyangiales bacterium]|nr:Glu/Leu/Phe/Val dehydrogenase dimerization domain-containing protein [Polyangiales bacterium]